MLFLSKDGTSFDRKIKLGPKLLLTIFHFVLLFISMNLDNKQHEISVSVQCTFYQAIFCKELDNAVSSFFFFSSASFSTCKPRVFPSHFSADWANFNILHSGRGFTRNNPFFLEFCAKGNCLCYIRGKQNFKIATLRYSDLFPQR